MRRRIQLAADAFRSYRLIPVEHRALWMRKLATLLEGEIERAGDNDYVRDGQAARGLAAGGFEMCGCVPFLR